ncbi:MAG: N-acetyl-gamma-glutamyl-phosphate reductase [Proteobacteria bacterium]|nr:N-acetyl-gamma-glutamyl-phosphate reductase [Pseudomonadota bacterium]
MKPLIFIDGAVGTTGLEIHERLADRRDVELVRLGESERKDSRARGEALNRADLVILCLPDEAAREAVTLIQSNSVKVIDASTAHRVAPGWTYGFPEMEARQRAKIANSNRVANPGCWPTGFLALVCPLTRAGIIPSDFPLTVNGVSGYSGGGKTMIEEFENAKSPHYVETVARSYALSLAHKHAPEMKVYSGLTHGPVFSPNVGRYYRGMIVDVPLPLWALPKKATPAQIHAVLSEAYRDEPFVEVAGPEETASLKTLDAEQLKNTNMLKLYVFANEGMEQLRLTAVLDNLGKGASGAAVQNMNIMLGFPETAGLI